MARYVVLSFPDNDDATAFVEGKDHRAEVVGVYAQPTMFCESFGGCSTGRVKPFTRGTKFGWWVCSGCRKPVKLSAEKLARHIISQGTNLLDVEGQEVAEVFDRGWGALGKHG